MCPAGQSVALAAYERRTGAFRWAACSSALPVFRNVLAITDGVVYVDVNGNEQRTILSFNASDGSELPSGGPVASRPTLPDLSAGSDGSTTIDGVRLTGGQKGPITATDVASSSVLWTHPGSTVYDDVWAVGDRAVFVAVEQPAARQIVAYELKSGKIRWQTPAGEYPWYVEGGVLFNMWGNLRLMSTSDGSTIWQTNYRGPGSGDRMSSVRANATSVFVSFSSAPSDGD
jgi:hypothetical protein